MSAAVGFVGQGLKNEFKIAVENEPSVFEPLKFYYTFKVSAERTRKRDSESAIPEAKCIIDYTIAANMTAG